MLTSNQIKSLNFYVFKPGTRTVYKISKRKKYAKLGL